MTYKHRPVTALLAALCTLGMVTSCSSGSKDQEETPVSQESTQDSSTSAAPKSYQPGTVTTDKFGRRLVIPKNPGGDKLSDKVEEPKDMCSDKEKKRIPASMELQKIGNAGAVFSSSDGPTKTDGDVPDGYAHTIPGAILTMLNYVNFNAVGGKYNDAAEMRFGGLSEQEKKDLKPSKLRRDDPFTYAMFPGGHRVVTCSKDVVVVQLAFPSFEDSAGRHSTPQWAYHVAPMIWKGDHWEIDKQSPFSDPDAVPTHISDIGDSLDDSWVKWTL